MLGHDKKFQRNKINFAKHFNATKISFTTNLFQPKRTKFYFTKRTHPTPKSLSTQNPCPRDQIK
jgi:hypothetical protein